MPQITILVGPPGSGKSTLAKEYCAKGGVVYINQDSQGKGGHMQLFDEAIAAGLDDIVVDRMGFSREQRKRYILPAFARGYSSQITVLHESRETCLARCLARKDHETIQDEKSARSAIDFFFCKYERPQADEADKVNFIYPEGDKPSAIICDLDGTLCNVDHRLHFVRRPEGEKKDWHGFFLGMTEDPVNQWCADILNELSDNHTIVYCSGRPDSWKKQTVDWLKKFSLHDLNMRGFFMKEEDLKLYMRPRSDNRDDSIVKEIILDFEILTRFKPYFMIDDRKRVVDMWRKRGFVTLQCAHGEF